MLTKNKVEFLKLQKVYNALSDEIRLKMVKLLSVYGEICVCQFQEAFDIPQPNLSFHLRILREARLVNSEKRGKWTYYSLNRDDMVIQANMAMIEELEISEKIDTCKMLG